MLRTVLVLALTWAAAPLALPAASAGPISDMPCDALDCPRPIVGANDERVCAGVGFSTGGTAVCHVFEGNCVQRHFGFAYSETCLGDVTAVVGPGVLLP